MNRQLLNHMGLLQKKFYVGLCILAILTDSLAHAQVNVEPNTAVLNVGDPTELLCRYAHHTITYCRIEIPGEPVFNLSPEWNKTPGFTYFGKGLQAGECGVSIQHIKAVNNGQVKCSLGVEGEEITSTIDLVVALRPKQPLVELITKPDHEGYFSEDGTFKARCIVPEGRPAANITWFLDNERADKTVGDLEEIVGTAANGLKLSTTIQEIQWHLTPEDNGRKLICRSHHQTDRENSPPQEGSYILLVRYAPVRKEDISVYGLYLDHTATVNMTIRSNPSPIVEWTLDGKVVRQGEQEGRFSVYEPVYLGKDMYNVTLVIAGLTLEDTTKTYNLRASNALGTTDYIVRISSSATPPASGLEIGAIVGIVVAVAVLVMIVLLLIFARATGRWCFGGKSAKMSANETNNTQQHGQNVALLEVPNGITIIGNRSATDNGSEYTHNNDDETEVQKRNLRNDHEDDSFEYGTDRESSVYNPTTMPIRSVMAQAGGRYSQKSNDSDSSHDQSDLMTKGNQLGIPESRFSRWIPKDQREILEKQAKIMAERMKPKTPEPKRNIPAIKVTAEATKNSPSPSPPTETEI